MKTLKYAIIVRSRSALVLMLCLFGLNPHLHSQESADTEEAPKVIRPDMSDGPSLKLIQNYLTASGGKAKHRQLRNVQVTGQYKEAKDLKYFTLIETYKGERYFQLQWKLRGIQYEEIYAFDGLEAWQQRTLPDDKKRNLAKAYSGRTAIHFANQRWFFQPFNLPLSPKYVFDYQGTDTVAGRATHMVVGYGPKNERSWFYFDQETFLVTRWGGIGAVSGGQAYLDYQAKGFKAVDGIFLPTGLTLLAKGQPYGEVVFESIETNVDVEVGLFKKPAAYIPTLRSVPAQ